jgi:hypothetical protein
MTSTIDAPARPEVRVACPPEPPTGPPTEAARVVVRRLPQQCPVAGPTGPEPLADPPSAGQAASAPGMAVGMATAGHEVRTVLQMTMETLDGRRPRSQLSGRLSKEVLRYLAVAAGRLSPAGDRRAAALRGRHGPPALRTVRLSHPTEGVAEASAVWRHRGRIRALAARFEWTGTKWVCTALRFG